MTPIAAARAIKKGLSGIAIAREHLLRRIATRHPVRPERFGRARVKKRRNVAHLLIRKWHRRHALVRPALMNDAADKVPLHVVRHKRRADKVWPARACCIRTMAEATGLLELLMSAFDGGVRRFCFLLPSRGVHCC